MRDKDRDRERIATIKCRNYRFRKKVEIWARSLMRFREEKPEMADCIKGIDACSAEIGCRPENFATEFRYLRDTFDLSRTKYDFDEDRRCKALRITYHVGEDFLDICDGLRAVDEAVEFLEMQNGDRIGHGTVLGLNSQLYYDKKERVVYLSKQDLLDNLVWMLYRSLEWGIEISPDMRERSAERAMKLLRDIYPDKREYCNLRNCYDSWSMRGYYPNLFLYSGYKFKDLKGEKRWLTQANQYDYYKIPTKERMNVEEKMIIGERIVFFNKEATELYHLYHFDSDVKFRGAQIEEYRIEQWYIDLMNKLQLEMRRKVANKGISIECNPTSNRLIAPIDRYDEHPIWVFNKSGLDSKVEGPQMSVCVNTDDIGVFATSLENEYALLLVSECRRRREHNCEDDEPVYRYINRLRENGFVLSFGDIMTDN